MQPPRMEFRDLGRSAVRLASLSVTAGRCCVGLWCSLLLPVVLHRRFAQQHVPHGVAVLCHVARLQDCHLGAADAADEVHVAFRTGLLVEPGQSNAWAAISHWYRFLCDVRSAVLHEQKIERLLQQLLLRHALLQRQLFELLDHCRVVMRGQQARRHRLSEVVTRERRGLRTTVRRASPEMMLPRGAGAFSTLRRFVTLPFLALRLATRISAWRHLSDRHGQ